MNLSSFFTYLAIMALSTYLIRALPFALLQKKLKNPFLLSFLHYIPYTVLTVMTVPGALYATGHVSSAVIGLIAAVLTALRGKGLTLVAACACVCTLLTECLLLIL